MRRLAALVVLILGLTVAPAPARQMDPYAGVDQIALSLWILEEAGKVTLYVAMGGRYAEAFSTAPDVRLPAFGLVGKGPCGFTKKGGLCKVRGKAHPLVTEFEMDPLMDSAHMTLDTGRFVHVVDWTGERSVSQDASQDGTDAYAYMYRPASVKAKLFNRRFDGGDFISMMQNSAYASAGARFVTMHEDGTFSARIALDRDGNVTTR